VRIGVAAGEAIEEKGDRYRAAVNLAATQVVQAESKEARHIQTDLSYRAMNLLNGSDGF
jgi:hypothetical protein